MTLQIRGVHPIALTVSDPNRSNFTKKILGKKASRENPQVRWISCGNFLLAFQRPPHRALQDDQFAENRLGLDHVGFAVESHQQLYELMAVIHVH